MWKSHQRDLSQTQLWQITLYPAVLNCVTYTCLKNSISLCPFDSQYQCCISNTCKCIRLDSAARYAGYFSIYIIRIAIMISICRLLWSIFYLLWWYLYKHIDDIKYSMKYICWLHGLGPFGTVWTCLLKFSAVTVKTNAGLVRNAKLILWIKWA